jgi:hypothetical protein
MNLGIKSAQFYDDFKIAGKVAKQIRKKSFRPKNAGNNSCKIFFPLFQWI